MSICCLSAYADKVPEDAAKVCPIKVGQEIPKVTLQGIDGKNVDLAAKIGEKPTVLVFYRGGWCPYCNVHLGELKTIESDLKAMGYQIVAISPDLPKNLKQSMDKNEISYTLLSDSKATAVKAMGLAFKVDAETYKKYLGYNIDLEEASGEKHHILPVPAALITDTSGKVRFSFHSPDYKVRIDTDVLLAAAKSALK
ncbi:peroxiredoxin-like family protein [Agarilytica rhodophyticola]|uniref:peroxiredoxin-like family protein n=1 Tax=Agarilytica rhodophyticola TaxID=1737490 RepID=UPI000B346EBD|nr:peroxiredoxin-like family protein [Agarilytica rhodophyticola]